jgi:hypothetical protein
VDVAVLEVGLGGRLDATNVVRAPVVCGVASLGFDHMEVPPGRPPPPALSKRNPNPTLTLSNYACARRRQFGLRPHAGAASLCELRGLGKLIAHQTATLARRPV